MDSDRDNNTPLSVVAQKGQFVLDMIDSIAESHFEKACIVTYINNMMQSSFIFNSMKNASPTLALDFKTFCCSDEEKE